VQFNTADPILMNIQFLTPLFCFCVLWAPVEAQQSPLNWSHVYKKNGTQLVITKFNALTDSVLLRYECSPKSTDHTELRSRPLKNGTVTDSTYINCPDNLKIIAQTADSTYVNFVPQKMLLGLIKKNHPEWFN
jgi:hypothetical protein